jgi:hypothetical protein
MESKETVGLALFLSYCNLTEDCQGFQSLDLVPFRAGIPRDWTSDLEKFEALDPAEWCPRGYAIVNIDPRGVFDSDGDIAAHGTQVSPLTYLSLYFTMLIFVVP